MSRNISNARIHELWEEASGALDPALVFARALLKEVNGPKKPALRYEKMDTGILVIGTNDGDEAYQFLTAEGQTEGWEVHFYKPGRWHKVPAQWADWALFEVKPGASTNGSFLGVILKPVATTGEDLG